MPETQRYVPGAWAVVRIVVLVIMLMTLWDVHKTSDKLCAATHANRTYIRNAILRGQKTIPTFTYYKQHPAELVKAEQEITQELADLPNDVCA